MPSTEARGTFGISPFYPANNGNNSPKTLPRDRSLKRRTDLSADVFSGCAVLTWQTTPQRFGKQLFATTTFCTWLEALIC